MDESDRILAELIGEYGNNIDSVPESSEELTTQIKNMKNSAHGLTEEITDIKSKLKQLWAYKIATGHLLIKNNDGFVKVPAKTTQFPLD